MNNSPLIYAFAALLCAGLFFSCAPEIELPSPQNKQTSSSGTEQPPLSQPNDNPSSSSTQAPPISSPAQSSSSVAKSSSSSAQIIVGSPDYSIECSDWDESCYDTVYLSYGECVEISILNNTNSYNGELSMACEAEGNGSIAFTLTLDGKSVSAKSNYYVEDYIPIGRLKKGNNQFGPLCLIVLSGSITNTVECSGPYSIDN